MTSQPNEGGPKLAPAPPPPPEEVLSRATRAASGPPQGGGGFDPRPGRMLGELLGFAVFIVALVMLAYRFAGTLAAWATPLVPYEVDKKLGQISSRQLSMTQAPCSPRAQEYVRSILAPLLEAAGPTPFEFDVSVARDDSVNAFALPGGFLTVNSGLLEKAESGEEVAGVLGHEIQHALLRHGTKRILRDLGGGMVLGLIAGSDPTGLSGAAGLLTSLSYDRDQESEADARGVELLVRAGIDPSGLGRFFERLEKEGGPTPPAFLSTHPDPGERAMLAARTKPRDSTRTLPAPPRPVCDP